MTTGGPMILSRVGILALRIEANPARVAIWDDGRRARELGCVEEDCPFAEGTGDRAAWLGGWRERDRAMTRGLG